MSKQQLDKVFEFVESKGLLGELEEYLKPKADEQKPDRFASLKALVGAKANKPFAKGEVQEYVLRVFETQDGLSQAEVTDAVNALLEKDAKASRVTSGNVGPILYKHLVEEKKIRKEDQGEDEKGKAKPALYYKVTEKATAKGGKK
jgi:hypothetical protein